MFARPPQSPDSCSFNSQINWYQMRNPRDAGKTFRGIVVYTSLEEPKVRQDSKALRRPQPRVCSLRYGPAKWSQKPWPYGAPSPPTQPRERGVPTNVQTLPPWRCSSLLARAAPGLLSKALIISLAAVSYRLQPYPWQNLSLLNSSKGSLMG